MAVRYDKLWEHLKFNQIDKSELQILAGISAPTMTRLIKNKFDGYNSANLLYSSL